MNKHKLYVTKDGKVKYTIILDWYCHNAEEINIIINGKVRKCIRKDITGTYKLRYDNHNFDIGKIIYLTLHRLKWEDGIGKSIKFVNGNKQDISKFNLELVNRTRSTEKLKYKVVMKPDIIEFDSISDAAEWIQKNTDSKAQRSTLQSAISKHIKKLPDKNGRFIKTIFGKTFEKVGK